MSMVIKRGGATGVTIGRANNIFSKIRYFSSKAEPQTSQEWCILPFDNKHAPFSDVGDSGSVIVDGRGRIGGLLTGGGGNGITLSSDVTYATPIGFLLKRMKQNGLDPNLNPVLTS